MPPDSLRAVLDSVFAAPAYRWVEPGDPLAVVRRWLSELSRWLFELRQNHPLGFRLLVAGLVVLLVAVLVHAGWVFLQTIRSTPAPGLIADPVPRRDRSWYQSEANRLAGQGRFVEAMQAEFLGLILGLDEAGLVRYHPAKTPREYASEPALPSRWRAELLELVGSLYGYAFARRPCGAAEFVGWQARVAEWQRGGGGADAAPS